jgi:hypothetical protein
VNKMHHVIERSDGPCSVCGNRDICHAFVPEQDPRFYCWCCARALLFAFAENCVHPAPAVDDQRLCYPNVLGLEALN